MADLVAGDLIYTELSSLVEDGSGYRVGTYAITTPAGAYPTGGLPLTNSKMRCQNALVELEIIEPNAAAPTHSYKYDRSANKIMVFVEDAVSGIAAEHPNSAFTSPDQLIVRSAGW